MAWQAWFGRAVSGAERFGMGRQAVSGEWGPVFARVKDELNAMVTP